MFRNLSNSTRIGIFSGLVLLLAVLFALLNSPVFLALYMFIPAFATLIMLFVVTGEGYTKSGLAQLGLHRLGLRYWPLAILLPIPVLLAGYWLVWTIDPASYQSFPGGIKWFNTALYFLAMVLYQTLTVSLGEELGWRGYLLPKLLPYGKLKAYIYLGLLWAVWHYPLIFLSGVYNAEGNKLVTTALFTLTVIALSLITGELRARTGSLWPASLFHSAHNTIWQLLVSLSVSTPLITYVASESGLIPLALYSIIAALLLIQSKRIPPTNSSH